MGHRAKGAWGKAAVLGDAVLTLDVAELHRVKGMKALWDGKQVRHRRGVEVHVAVLGQDCAVHTRDLRQQVGHGDTRPTC